MPRFVIEVPDGDATWWIWNFTKYGFDDGDNYPGNVEKVFEEIVAALKAGGIAVEANYFSSHQMYRLTWPSSGYDVPYGEELARAMEILHGKEWTPELTVPDWAKVLNE